MATVYYEIKWSVSKARDSYGYNICRLINKTTGAVYRTCGGGYDMIGTVVGDMLENECQERLQSVRERAHSVYDGRKVDHPHRPDSLYGMYDNMPSGKGGVTLDGGCGLESMLRIAEAIGLDYQRVFIKTGKKRGETIGYYFFNKGE